MKTALLVIDVQKAIVEENPYNYEEFLNVILCLINEFRKREMPILYIQHNGEKGSYMEPGSIPWQLVDHLDPLPGEDIIQKYFNSAFRKTMLEDKLNKKGIQRLIVTGFQSEYCIDTTLRVAFEKEYQVIVPEMGHSTVDNGVWSAKALYEHHHELFRDRFAQILELNDIVSLLDDEK